MKSLKIIVLLMMGICWMAPTGHAVIRVATSSGYWDATGTWADGNVPGAGEDAVISNNVKVILSNQTAWVNSLIISNGATLWFTNFAPNATLNASDVIIQTNGTIQVSTNTATATNALGVWPIDARVSIQCTNLFIAAGGQIYADAAGWAGGMGTAAPYYWYGFGPGRSKRFESGPSHGGSGGAETSLTSPAGVYDSTNAPSQPGSGGAGHSSGSPHRGGNGGGLILIAATNAVTVNGTISANGGPSANTGSAGSGGSINIACRTFAGTNGTLTANGGAGYVYGGGGRIAIVYTDTVQQGQMPVPSVAISCGSMDFSVGVGASISYQRAGDLGTLYTPDRALIQDPLPPISAQIMAPVTNWGFSQLTVANSFLRFPVPGVAITITNNLVVGTNAVFVLGGDSAAYRTSREYYTDATNGTALLVGGDLILTNGGVLYAAAARSSSVQPGYGTLVAVTGGLTVATGSVIYAHSHPTTGASVFFQANSVNVAPGGVIKADAFGFTGAAAGNTAGYGDGKSTTPYVGASHGGRGGAATGYSQVPVYGVTNAPAKPGSGGGGNDGADHRGGSGGGLIRIQAADAVRVDGLVTAKGGAAYNMGSGGSGGGIFISCLRFSGASSGSLLAQGGNSVKWTGNEGGGGGGRIAVWYRQISDAAATLIVNNQENLVPDISVSNGCPSFAGAIIVAGGTNLDAGAYNGETGTVRFITLLTRGTIVQLR